MSLRFHDTHIKSLLHFNYPYFGESGDGLADDIGAFSWARSGNARLAGSQSPADLILASTPKFGYRCLHTESNSDYITGSGNTLTLSQVEASFWLRPTSSAAGNVLLLKNGDTVILSLVLDASGKLNLSSSSLGLNFSSSESLSLNIWHYVRVQVSTSTANISINNSAGTSSAVNASSLPGFNKIQLGGLHGQIDEFVLRDILTSGLPAEPVKGSISLNSLGGFGSGSLGNVTIASNCVMCSYGLMSGETNGSAYAVNNITAGKFGSFKAGDEVMIHEQGYHSYCFRTITNISGNYFTFDSPIQMDVSAVIQVPHFNTLTINAGVTVSPVNAPIPSHGIVAFRCKGDCTINGSIITSGKGQARMSPSWEATTDAKAMHHAKIPDVFVCGSGGGVFIACGGTLTASSTARIGASWSGANLGGAANGGLNAGGGAGCGGGSSKGSTGQAGHVGYGGYSAGTQSLGAPAGRNSYIPLESVSTSGTSDTNNHPYSGASIFIITKRLRADEAAISTGGENAPVNSNPEVQGAGSGYCYIAAKELL